MKHTQGKWYVGKDIFGYCRIFRKPEKDKSQKLIALIGDNEANAKRIVLTHNSFDDLLEVCKMLVSGVEIIRSPNELKTTIKFAKQAIAQAEAE